MTWHALFVADLLSQKGKFHLANYLISIWLFILYLFLIFDFIFHIYSNTPMTNLVSLSVTGILIHFGNV